MEHIPGLYLIHDVFTECEANEYCSLIEVESKNPCPQIHPATEYGWRFIPPIKKTKDEYLECPEWLNKMWIKTMNSIKKHIPSFPQDINSYDNAIINQYQVGDGCVPHTDEHHFWTNWVVGVSYGSGCLMNFTCDDICIPIYIPKNSVYVMLDEVRYKWKHGIPFQKIDKFDGLDIERTKRTSVTFRVIVKEFLPDI